MPRIRTFMWTVLLLLMAGARFANASLPNIVLILADDLGYGDVACYNSESRVPTPHLDDLAASGLRFTDAHSPSTVCSPTRYSIMTGRMAFRTDMRGVFGGVQGPCLIEEGRLTLPAMLKQSGYVTALFGKWHIGMTFYDSDGNVIEDGGLSGVRRTDFSRAIPDGPVHRGFDRFFGTVACPGTDALYAYVDNDRIPIPPTHMLDRASLPQHYYGLDCDLGLIAEGFDHEQLDVVFLAHSLKFLQEHQRAGNTQPFFLMLSTHAVHLPSFPAQQFHGKTNAGPHGDFIFEFDHIVGEVVAELDALGFADNTLVVVTSDNGPEVPTILDMRKTYRHDGARPWRGVKRDNWEGGHRVPMIVRWPGEIEPGRTTDQTTCLTDLMATFAAIVGATLPADAAEDSYDLSAVFRSETKQPVREYTLHQTNRLALAIRHENWKYLDHAGSGGNDYQRGGNWGMQDYAMPDSVPNAPGQLYNLAVDPGETDNLYDAHPDVVRRLKQKLREYVDSGRSAPPR